MKTTLLTILTMVCLSVSSAHAYFNDRGEWVFTESTESYCQAQGNLSFAFALKRDTGLTKDQANEIADGWFYGLYNQNIGVFADTAFIIEYVYTFPYNEPTEEGNSIYRQCSGS